jgi:hypothetical protein
MDKGRITAAEYLASIGEDWSDRDAVHLGRVAADVAREFGHIRGMRPEMGREVNTWVPEVWAASLPEAIRRKNRAIAHFCERSTSVPDDVYADAVRTLEEAAQPQPRPYQLRRRLALSGAEVGGCLEIVIEVRS